MTLQVAHMKPFADCRRNERYDPDNGLLLAAHIDALFDKGLLSFTAKGRGLLSNSLRSTTISKLDLANLHLPALTTEQQFYLSWHRTHVFHLD